jgi:predicted dehydrogenase
MRIGLVGCGQIVEHAHLPAYRVLPDVAVVALMDVDGRRARALARLVGSGRPSCVDNLPALASAGVDVAVVATPSNHHAATIRVLIDLGVPSILCEKPLAPTLEEAADLVRLAGSRSVGLAVVHNYRHAEVWRLAAELIRDGRIGTPVAFGVRTSDPGPYPGAFAGNEQWRGSLRHAGRGCLTDQGYHYVYLAEYLLGSPVEDVAWARIASESGRWSVEDRADVELTHAGGGRTRISIDWLATERVPPRITVEGTGGVLDIDEDSDQITIGRDRLRTAGLDPHGYAGTFGAAFRRFRSNAGHLDTAEAQRTLALLDRCYEAAMAADPR